MTKQVKIITGHYRGQEVSGTFELVKPWQDGARGGYVTIRNMSPLQGHPPVQRVSCQVTDIEVIGSNGVDVIQPASTDYEQKFVTNESEDEAMERIGDTFSMLDKIVDACARSVVRGLVVSGPPGIGKSFGVEKQLEAANMFRKLEGKDPLYEVISGGVSSIGLYQKLYYNRGRDQVLVFDDCDGALLDEECLNLLKAALNSGDKRRISWNKESRVLHTEDIPSSFDFEASIIFLTNIDFERTINKGSRLASHLAAIMSRCHYMDLEIGSLRDQLLRIKQVVRDGMLVPYNFTADQEQAVMDFVFDNADHLREVSLRVVKKIADLAKADPKGWYEMAESTVLTKEAKFRRLYESKMKQAGAVAA